MANPNPYQTARANVLQPAPVHPAVNQTFRPPAVWAPQGNPVHSANMNEVHTILNNQDALTAALFQTS